METEEMYRAFGYNGRDEIVTYAEPRRDYDEATGDLIGVLETPGVFSAAIEKRLVVAGTVNFPSDAATPAAVVVEDPVPANAAEAQAAADAANAEKAKAAPPAKP